MSDSLAMRMKAIREGDMPRTDLFEADFDHERAAVLGSVIDLAFEATPVINIDVEDGLSPVIDVCEYGEDPERLKKVNAAKTVLKRAWSASIGDVLRVDTENQSLLEAAEAVANPSAGAAIDMPDVFGAYPHLRTLLNRGINTAVEESVNFSWTVPGVIGGSSGATADEAMAVRNSLDTLRSLAALDRRHLGPALVALKGARFIPNSHSIYTAEDPSSKGMNLGYRQDLFIADEGNTMKLKGDLLDLEVADTTGKTWQVWNVGPERIIPLGCPALKIRAFTAAVRGVIRTFDEHELWPAARSN
ncbi:MAG TPA: hypothetical protein VFX84_02625 [Candidatus Saccharimonadales bacterium]|nr:hypothetical protein [Candidatus Saccharimonadales bacterium]